MKIYRNLQIHTFTGSIAPLILGDEQTGRTILLLSIFLSVVENEDLFSFISVLTMCGCSWSFVPVVCHPICLLFDREKNQNFWNTALSQITKDENSVCTNNPSRTHIEGQFLLQTVCHGRWSARRPASQVAAKKLLGFLLVLKIKWNKTFHMQSWIFRRANTSLKEQTCRFRAEGGRRDRGAGGRQLG